MMYRNSWLPVVFNDFFNNVNMPKANATAPAINVKESDAKYTVELAAPGLRKDDFQIHVNAEGELAIKMENKQETEEKKEHYLRREFSYAKYEQNLILPDDVDKDKISARVADGVLTVELPKVKTQEQQVARQISVQ